MLELGCGVPSRLHCRGAGAIKVLAIDDSPAILDLIKEILTIHKYEVETAENGALGLDKYARVRPDIVTLDLSMPVMDGFETLKRIMSMDKDANVIMLTASEQQEILDRCLNKGAIGYIAKPFSAKELVASITSAWRAGADRKVVTLFLIAGNKIEGSIRKAFDSVSIVSIILTGVNIIRKQAATHVVSPYADLSQIRVVPHTIDEITISVPENAVGYITEFGGHQKGEIITSVAARDIAKLYNLTDIAGRKYTDVQVVDLFNVINMKLLSELANSSRLILSAAPTRVFDRSQSIVSNEVTKATYDMVIDQYRIPLEVQMTFSSGQVFRGGL